MPEATPTPAPPSPPAAPPALDTQAIAAAAAQQAPQSAAQAQAAAEATIGQQASKAAPAAAEKAAEAAEQAAAAEAAKGPVPNQPLITFGYTGPAVRLLCDLLAVCGFATNSVAQGTNARGLADNSVMADVAAFCTAHGVLEDPGLAATIGVQGAEVTGRLVGGQTWRALFEAAQKALETPAA